MIETLRTAGVLRRVTLHTDFAEAPLFVAMRRSAIEQVLVNLMKNAVRRWRYIDKSGCGSERSHATVHGNHSPLLSEVKPAAAADTPVELRAGQRQVAVLGRSLKCRPMKASLAVSTTNSR